MSGVDGTGDLIKYVEKVILYKIVLYEKNAKHYLISSLVYILVWHFSCLCKKLIIIYRLRQ